MNTRGYAVSICCDENVSRNIMNFFPLVANKRGICSRNININAIWVWAENTVNSSVLLHLNHQTHGGSGNLPSLPSFDDFQLLAPKECTKPYKPKKTHTHLPVIGVLALPPPSDPPTPGASQDCPADKLGMMRPWDVRCAESKKLPKKMILLMEEIPNNHLGWCKNPVNNGINY